MEVLDVPLFWGRRYRQDFVPGNIVSEFIYEGITFSCLLMQVSARIQKICCLRLGEIFLRVKG